MRLPLLDRYLLREWARIFGFTTIGFPLVVLLFELTDKLDQYLVRGLAPETVALAYLFSLPDKVFMVLPAAVLFATTFSLGAMARHSELAAAKASGRSFHRTVIPVLVAAVLATGLGLVIGELAPPATRRQLELLGELEQRTANSRFNFVFRAEAGWTYALRELDVRAGRATGLVLEREGRGEVYPTLAAQGRRGRYNDSLARWTLEDGQFRIMAEGRSPLTFAFDSMRLATFVEPPQALLVEPKKPEEMRYAELGRYIDALERSGGDGRQLRVGHALKIAVPFTCLIIALFGAPLVMTAPRASGAFGVAVSLGTTVAFLTLIQLSRAVGGGGLIPPTLAAWLPNLAFGAAGVWMLRRTPT